MSDRRAEREAEKQRRDRRGQMIAAVSTVVVIGGIIALIVTSPGWPVVRDSFFNYEVFTDSFPDILKAFWLDVQRVRGRGGGGADPRPGGGAGADLADRPPCFRAVSCVVYVDVFRGIPTILLVYLVGFGVPALAVATEDGSTPLGWLPTEPVILGGIALTLSYGAYVAEVYRAGLNSVHRGSVTPPWQSASRRAQSLRHVIVPQAVRRVWPPLLNDFIALQKDVALMRLSGSPVRRFV